MTQTDRLIREKPEETDELKSFLIAEEKLIEELSHGIILTCWQTF
jgi:hypothetical protein